MVEESAAEFKQKTDNKIWSEILEKHAYKITIVPAQRSVKDVAQDVLLGRIEVQPEFQRKYIWTAEKATMLIMTILRGAGIPEMWLTEYEQVREKRGKKVRWEVIDGQQRLQSLAYVVSNVIKFAGFSENFEAFNGYKFQDLPEPIQDRILDYPLRFAIVKGHEYNPYIRNYFFRVLNQNMRILRRQELRNCQYAGKYNDLLRNLAETRLREFKIHERDRFEDVVLLLKAFALRDNYREYSREETFLDKFMEKMNLRYETMSNEAREQEFLQLTSEVDAGLQLAKGIFNRDVFLMPRLNETNLIVWKESAGHISSDAFVILMTGFLSHLPQAEALMRHSKEVRNSFCDLVIKTLNRNSLFQSKRRLIDLFDDWNANLDSVANTHD